MSYQAVKPHPVWHSSTAGDWSHYNALPYHYWQTDRQTEDRVIADTIQSRDRSVDKMTIWVSILMKQTSAHRVGPCSVSLLCLSSKAKGYNWTTVLFRVSIGDNFYLPVKGWCLYRHTQINGTLSELQWQILKWYYDAYLNWYRTSSIDKCASGQPSSSTWISQKCNRGQTGWEHTGTDWREYSGRAPSDLFGLKEQANQIKCKSIK